MSYERVLLPVSGKHSGERALKALSQARKLDPREIILLHAVAPSVGSPMPNLTSDKQDVTVKAEALLAPLAAELDHAGIAHQTVILHGLPVETIVKTAREMDAEAIVMFSDGYDDLADKLFGSITEHVLRSTPLPVLVVRQ
ncbi:universal stress protein [uncultured Desulfovibrio sp.]|uniref:universal stress protein n=1 Tax=uncultured Desulfovibrio sp. TaxID=167968 RepID=UPI00266F7C0E|nr:universal stress protein [uncultured Desulfovibrio sp.]